ncbi:MAG: hypothetical protein IT262_22605 [Saprospiraceae bacterium]|nr:hypothetical protein [Saprospiraceae bacterium]
MRTKNLASLMAKLEALQEVEMGQLQGGFASLSAKASMAALDAKNDHCPITNNCDGGNCVVNCGKTM